MPRQKELGEKSRATLCGPQNRVSVVVGGGSVGEFRSGLALKNDNDRDLNQQPRPFFLFCFLTEVFWKEKLLQLALTHMKLQVLYRQDGRLPKHVQSFR